MSARNAKLADLSPEDRVALENWLIEFDSTWTEKELARQVAALPADAAWRKAALFEMIKIDLERRWQLGRAVRLEKYLVAFPELGTADNVSAELIVAEIDARKSSAQPATEPEIVARFPQQAVAVNELLGRIRSSSIRRSRTPKGSVGTMALPAAPRQVSLHDVRRADVQTVQGDAIKHFGRYRSIRLLGQGTFARVWLGFDEELQRHIAIKVPTPERFRIPEDAEEYLVEARIVAQLDHPHIVPVYDVGRSVDGSVYVISKFIEGCSLADLIGRARPRPETSARLLATVARALDHAHSKGLIHRDIKPANILIERRAQIPYVADFGLAISETDHVRFSELAGTPAYMSPEQVRGEAHRLDARSDIFSLGVVLYELLTGNRPFSGRSAKEVFHQIVSVEPAPPRELDSTIPAELERICLKALSKRISDRYSTAAELADDLIAWKQGPKPTRTETRVVPKGLRAFEAHDAEFFLTLLPGPRNREGLPHSIQFWKSCCEETDPGQTFSVGLLYGPSGCGKSSFVKAGLLPRLSKRLVTVYVEATPDETERQILFALRRHLSDLPRDCGLVEAFAWLRRRKGSKVVVWLDQFEQWLHAHPAEQAGELIGALRHCDGARVQAIVMVRDEFGMAVTRFMSALDIPVVQGRNFATIDLFDVGHARQVLVKFGQAFGRLPQRAADLSQDQNAFLSTVIERLAQDGKVVCVHLSLFAEMLKDRAWDMETLRAVGGAEGVGVSFLDETFHARSANPARRRHLQAARLTLKSLLPEIGSDIRGHMRSHAELSKASGYEGRPTEFRQLLRMLDSELRVITPADPSGSSPDSDSDAEAKYYQLTHDYLVPALRQWLTCKQRETRRGRAELLLADRTAVWCATSVNRFLPSVSEWARIRLLTSRQRWTGPESRMMKRAAAVHMRRAAALSALLAAAIVIGLYVRAGVLVSNLERAELTQAATIVRELGPVRLFANSQLRALYQRHEADSPGRLKAALALLPADPGQVDYLRVQLLKSDPVTFRVIREALAGYADQLVDVLSTTLADGSVDPKSRFNAACALAAYRPDAADRWGSADEFVTDQLISGVLQNPSHYDLTVDALRPVRKHLEGPLAKIFRDPARSDAERQMATTLLTNYAADEPVRLAELALDADPKQCAILFPMLTRDAPAATRRLIQELSRSLDNDPCDPRNEALAKRQANAAAALLRLGSTAAVWPLFKHPGTAENFADPRVRSYLIHRLAPLGCNAELVIEQLERESDVSARRALILALGEFNADQVIDARRKAVGSKLLEVFRDDPDAGVHAAAEWLLGRWGLEAAAVRLRQAELETGKPEGQRQWYVNRQGQTLAMFRGPVTYLMGSPPTDPERYGGANDPREQQHLVIIPRSFEVSIQEVTLEQFLRFRPKHVFANHYVSPKGKVDLRCPVTYASWYDVVAYCNWLNEQEGIPRDQWCFQPNEKGEYADGMLVVAGWAERTGYRLPTDAEWEYAARACASTSRSYGETEELLGQYGWYFKVSQDRSMIPVGSLKPNDFGMFDMLGNAYEWCQNDVFVRNAPGGRDQGATMRSQFSQILRGGSWGTQALNLRAPYRSGNMVGARINYYGFRLARTHSVSRGEQ